MKSQGNEFSKYKDECTDHYEHVIYSNRKSIIFLQNTGHIFVSTIAAILGVFLLSYFLHEYNREPLPEVQRTINKLDHLILESCLAKQQINDEAGYEKIPLEPPCHDLE